MLGTGQVKLPRVGEHGSPHTNLVLPVVAIAFAIAVFVVDTFSPLGIAVAALYAVVVLMAGRFLERRGVLVVAVACCGLTVLSYAIQHGSTYGPASVRAAVSLVAIAVTTFLALKSQAADVKLREQAGLLEITHDAVIVRDMDDVITFWNRAAEELYGCPREKALGKLSHTLLRTSFPEPLEDIKATLIATGRWEGELTQERCEDGTELTVASRWSLQRDARGRPVATLETSNDVTKRKRAENALRRSEAELAHVTRVMTLGELTASIAHEVNQPLAAIVTNGEATLRWLDLDPPETDEVRGALRRIINDSHRASEVIKRLRALTKKADPDLGPLDMNTAINDVVTLIQRELSRHHVRLELNLDPGLPPTIGDRVELQQVLINLIMNGIEAMATGEERLLKIRSATDNHSRVIVSVEDSGTGFESDQLEHLCQAFVTTKASGMGMGLSICRSIIERHGGELWATPNEDSGATFYFAVPACQGQSS